MNKFKQKIYQKISNIKTPSIISISILGSFPKKRIKNVNDIDILIIFDKLNSKIYKNLLKEFKQIAKEITTRKIKAIVETRMGPIKPKKVKDKKVLQFHLLVYDLNLLKKIGEPIWFNALHNYKFIKGKQLNKIRSLKKISKKALLKDLQKFEGDIKGRFGWYNQYKIKNNKLELKLDQKIKLTNQYKKESIVFSIEVALMNYFCYKGFIVGKNREKLKKLSRKLPLQLQKEYFKIIRIYKKQGIKELRETAKLFLKELGKLIK
ncbi:MAG: hypothetical protein KJ646_02685 [Nanoarchaeota archaeon]|nr:hypothetical protein [Nanoarchaeota archaeon]MBU4116434.1 hypothetical protein [Nanoarchaeota archaeon]